MSESKYNVSQIIQSPGNEPVLVGWGSRLSPVSAVSSVASIVEAEDREDDGVPIQVDLRGILVSLAGPTPNVDLIAILDDIIVTADQMKADLLDESEGHVRKGMEHLVAQTITVHQLIKNW